MKKTAFNQSVRSEEELAGSLKWFKLYIRYMLDDYDEVAEFVENEVLPEDVILSCILVGNSLYIPLYLKLSVYVSKQDRKVKDIVTRV